MASAVEESVESSAGASLHLARRALHIPSSETAKCVHLKVTLLSPSNELCLLTFFKLLSGESPKIQKLLDPVGVEWGLRRLQHHGKETRMTLWALSSSPLFSELREELCSMSHAILLLIDASVSSASAQLEQLNALVKETLVSLSNNAPSHRLPLLCLAAAVS
ncbi:hypothetical protein Efla_000081 [Eimeria flavescens]